MTCLDETELLDLLEGRLSPDEEAIAKRHVDDCDDCRELLAATAKSMFSGAPLAEEDVQDSANPDDTARLARGNSVGRYVVLDVIGAGGMGVVYAAYDPELDRKVALKLLRRDLAAGGSRGELQKRLLREAQAMAKLSHPNVVTVFDAGTTQGRVFLTMELVLGTSLAAWLSRKDRPWTEVLEVYTLAGRGLSAAHAAGLVHRDFKPDNVLVAADGQVRVTDFGLARSLDRDKHPSERLVAALPPEMRQAHLSELTRPGTMAGTPAYMAPEQFLGHPADRATDQFNFAVALYEGLYKERPFAGKTTMELEEEVVAGRVKPAPKDSPIPARVRRVLLRALSVPREARFASMDEMLDALVPGRWKVRRRFVIVAAVVGIVAAGLVGYRSRREQTICTGAERKLLGVWDAERRQAVEKAFLTTGKPYAPDAWKGAARNLDAYTSGWVKAHTDACEATHFRGEQSEELLDLRVACLDTHLRQTAALTKLFSEADSEVVEHAVEASQSLPSVNECADAQNLRSSVSPPQDPATNAKVEATRLKLARVKALEKAGKYREALSLAEPALAAARAIGYLPLEAEALYQVGRAAGGLEDEKRAESALRDAADAAEAAGNHEIAARAWIALMYFVGNKGAKYDQATQWSRYAEVAIGRLGERDELEADRLETFSIILWKQSKYAEALAALQRALALYQKRLGPEHISVARTLDGIATVYIDQGKLEDAYDLDRQALTIAEKALGATHPSLTIFLNNMGNCLLFLGRYTEALESLERALDIATTTMGPEHPATIAPLDTLGEVLTALGRYDEALGALARAQANLDKSERKDNPDYATVLNDIGDVARLRGDPERALELNRRALALLEAVLGKEHPDVGMCTFQMARAKLGQGHAADALALDEKALAIVDRGTGAESLNTATVLGGVGDALLALGQPTRATAPLERALSLRQARPGDPRDVADVRFSLARALWGSPADRGRALELARDAHATYARAPHFKARLDALDAWLAVVTRE